MFSMLFFILMLILQYKQLRMYSRVQWADLQQPDKQPVAEKTLSSTERQKKESSNKYNKGFQGSSP